MWKRLQPARTPLALKNLSHNLRRLAAALLGIGFAVVLMFAETGFMYGLLDSQAQLIADLKADLVLVNRAQYALPAGEKFSAQRAYQARSCPGVAAVYPLYIEAFNSVWKEPVAKKYCPIRVLAFDLDHPVFQTPEVNEQVDSLRPPETALVDSKSKQKSYGFPGPGEEPGPEEEAEICDRSVRLVGKFPLGTDFANDGNLVMSAPNFAGYFPYRAIGDDPLSVVDLAVVRLEPGADAAAVQSRLEALLPDDVSVLTKDQFLFNEKDFWANSTPIGSIFITGTVVGFLVGVIICYQVIYSDIAEHEGEYATLKAMGYPNRYFVSVILQTSLYLSILSYLPGLLLSLVLYAILAEQTGLLMSLTLPRAALVFALTLGMCTLSGCLAMRKVFAADPADLF